MSNHYRLLVKHQTSIIMQFATLTALCVVMTLGMALADYGSGYGYTQYVPAYGAGYGAGAGAGAGGFGNGGFLMLIGLLFLFTILLGNNSLFNFTSGSGSSTTPITIVQG